MTDAAERQVMFILSVKAGNGRALGLSRKIEAIYEADGRADSLSILVTEHGAHAYEASKSFAEKHGKNGLIFICGGDGSTSEVANALAHKDTAMGVLPLGTANDFSKMLCSRKDARHLETLLVRTLKPEIKKIDLIRLNGFYAINIVSFGYDTIVLKNALWIMEKLPFVGKTGYALGVVKSLFSRKHFDLALEWEDEKGQHHSSDTPLILGAICNGGYYGNGFMPAPMAKIDDGVLQICLAETMKMRELLPLISRYKKGKHLTHPKIQIANAVRGVVRPLGGETHVLANYDGIVLEDPEVRFEVEKDALNLAYI